MRESKPKRKHWMTSLILEILGVRRQLRDIQEAQQRMETKMVELDNLKAAVARAADEILKAIAKLGEPKISPADVQAEADKLNAAVDALKAAVEA